MGKIVVDEFMSLDGVVQAPGEADEDTSGGFRHGGWQAQYLDDRVMQTVLQNVVDAGAFLLGRRTYEIFAAYWPTAPEDVQMLAEPLNAKAKYVASRTRSNPLDWQNSTVLEGDVADAVRSLKDRDDGELHVIGSTELVRTLLENDLVDELRLTIDPLLLGGGKRLFADDGVRRPLQLVNSEVTTTGAILATYAPA